MAHTVHISHFPDLFINGWAFESPLPFSCRGLCCCEILSYRSRIYLELLGHMVILPPPPKLFWESLVTEPPGPRTGWVPESHFCYNVEGRVWLSLANEREKSEHRGRCLRPRGRRLCPVSQVPRDYHSISENSSKCYKPLPWQETKLNKVLEEPRNRAEDSQPKLPGLPLPYPCCSSAWSTSQ